MLTDTHCHLFKEYFRDIDKVLMSARENNVCKYISAADNIDTIYEMIDLAYRYDDIYIAIGIHPENIVDNYEFLNNIIKENINNKKLVAIGEIGLDYYYGKETRSEQIELFEYQLKLAELYNLPVVVHSREATLDTITLLKKYKVTGVVHCFNGSLETAKELIKMGFYIGVGGVMTFKNSKIDEVIKEIPLDRILLETDSPYLTPEPFRKYSNEPKYIRTIAEYLANIKNINISEVEKVTEINVHNLFLI
jgi:TatD DNase family protein